MKNNLKRRVWVEVDLARISSNYRKIAASVKPAAVLAVLKANAVLIAKDFVHVESACSGRCITKDVLQVAVLASLHADDAMAGIDARVNSLDGFVDVGAVNVTAKDVIAHLKRNLLTIVEGILDDDDGPYRPSQTLP